MNTPLKIEHCLSFINCQLQPIARSRPLPEPFFKKQAVTISRQSGCGADVVAQTLADYLQTHAPPGTPRWTVFDRNLVEQVLADHELPLRLARFMPEDRIREIDNIMDELFGLHPPSWTLVQQTSETILRLVQLGKVIIVGRGANVIAADVPHALHVRLVGSVHRRIENKQHLQGLERSEAANLIRQEDLGRERYFRKHFNKDINDPLLYHLVINTDLVQSDAAARIIGDLVLESAPASA